MATFDDLWGGQLNSFAFDPTAHACDLRVTTLHEGVSTVYHVVCRGVSDIRFHNAIPEPWTYAEVTEAHLGTDGYTGRHTLELVLWSEDADLVVTSSSIEIREVRR
jgi:hypothetical protein